LDTAGARGVGGCGAFFGALGRLELLTGGFVGVLLKTDSIAVEAFERDFFLGGMVISYFNQV
jgi:hypothetical protein